MLILLHCVCAVHDLAAGARPRASELLEDALPCCVHAIVCLNNCSSDVLWWRAWPLRRYGADETLSFAVVSSYHALMHVQAAPPPVGLTTGVSHMLSRCVKGAHRNVCAPMCSLFGHQIVCHLVESTYRAQDYFNPVGAAVCSACYRVEWVRRGG